MSNNKSDLFNQIKNKTGILNVIDDAGFANPESDSSIVAKEDGNTTMAAGTYAQIKLDKEAGCIVENSLMSTENTVVKSINVNDININKHKFNNQLIDLTDFKNINGNIMGNILINGTVLVKTWEHSLQKWVLIRRPISTPMFSHRLNVPSTPEQMEVNLNALDDIRKYYIES